MNRTTAVDLALNAAADTPLAAALRALYQTVQMRKRPEDVAQMLLDLPGASWGMTERATLAKAAKQSLKANVWGYTSLRDDFQRPVSMERQMQKAQELFSGAPTLTETDCHNPDTIEVFLRAISPQIGKTWGANDFRSDRLNHEARHDAGLDLSRRQYNKRFRILKRAEERLLRLAQEVKKYEFTRIGKSGLATFLPFDDFARDGNTACFVAYLTARMNLRSEFTNTSQVRAFDEIAEMLLNRCKRSQTAHWWAVAHVYPQPDVLTHLTDEQKGTLLARWFGLLQDIAGLLKEVWERSNINRETMIVRRGNDSSTWNQTAGAWNRARDGWIALLYAMGMEGVLMLICPGKVLRLMAADVAYWHRASGGSLDPNTQVWANLPLPWETLLGQVSCPRGLVENVCATFGLDPVKSGWTGLRARAAVAAFTPTPELVHGVTVANPYLADVFRRAGVYSGKSLKAL